MRTVRGVGERFLRAAGPWRAEAQGELGPLLAREDDVHGALQTALVQRLDRRWPGLGVGPLPECVREPTLRLRAEHQLP